METCGRGPTPDGKRFRIAMIIYDDMTNQDFVGPNDIFARMPAVDIDVLAKTQDAVRTDARGRVLPDKAIRDAQAHYDLLFIGGGEGCIRLMQDAEVLDFLRSRARTATWITSVCVGALVLGAAGLLDGYGAATHWSCMDLLPFWGAKPTHERVVFDRNRITGGGVTAGIDFGFAVVGKIWGEEYAQVLQLLLEYDPQPPYRSGTPDKASAAVLALAHKMLDDLRGPRLREAQIYAHSHRVDPCCCGSPEALSEP